MKTALITGASRGIGLAISKKLAQLGFRIIMVATRENEDSLSAVKTLGEAQFHTCDVGNFTQVKELVDSIYKTYGSIDVLVNNAGITRDGLIISMKEDDFDKVIHVNLKGVFNFSKCVAKWMLKQRSGHIINISSIAGISGNAGQANYAASKAGVIGITKTLAKELASRGILCNAIAPGVIATDMTESVDIPVADLIPLGRVGQASEVADLVAFLIHQSYITGEVIRIDGGLGI